MASESKEVQAIFDSLRMAHEATKEWPEDIESVVKELPMALRMFINGFDIEELLDPVIRVKHHLDNAMLQLEVCESEK